jgi:prepilin-type N-terminal cleavage/methylation domain-containing protein
MTRDSAAFSLLELMAVVAIAGILAAAVSWSLGGRYASVQVTDVMERIALADRLIRMHAENRTAPVALVIDAGEGRFVRLTGDQADPLYTLPPRWRIERLESSGAARAAAGSTEPVVLRYGPTGIAPTWAAQLVDPQGREHWIVLAGVSGQVTRTHDEATVQNIIDAMRSTAPPGR